MYVWDLDDGIAGVVLFKKSILPLSNFGFKRFARLPLASFFVRDLIDDSNDGGWMG